MANDPTHLVFDQPPVPTPGPVRLVFGDDDAPAPAIPDATLHGAGRITGLRLHITARAGAQLAGGGRITGLRLHITAKYDINVSRPTVGGAHTRWQDAAPLPHAARSTWQQSAPLPVGTRSHWQDAAPLATSLRARWQDTQQLQRAVRSAFEQALRLPAAPLRSSFQEAERLHASARAGFQEAIRLPAAPLRVRFEETLRDRQARIGARFEVATPLAVPTASGMGIAVRLPRGWGARFQQAWPPRPGQWQRPAPPQPEPCYVPGLPAHLVFADPFDNSLPARLVFVCERHGPGPGPDPEPGETIVVPLRRVYVTVNSLTLVRVDGAVPIPAYSFGMSLDVDSWTWQWQATLHADALPLITPSANGDPVEVLATINGTPYRLCCEGYTRQRQFANTRIAVKGRGRAALLDAPYAPTLNHGNATARTAQQLMADVLTINGVGIGWGVDFGLADWLVPGNVWTHQGPYISAILDIAGAAGGYVQPHDTAATLRVLPRYPAAPWAWSTLTPNFELPAAVVSVEGTDWQQKAAYNRVYVAGTSAGVLGDVVRAGTAGEVLAPMVTHPLITHADAARQRGIAELSNTGRQAHLSLRLPVLQETGVIKPGALVRYVDAGTPRLGLVRGTQVEWSAPTLRQVLAVETHV